MATLPPVLRSVVFLFVLGGALGHPRIEAMAAPVRATFVADATVGSWRPLSPKDLIVVVRHAVLEELSRSGRLRLTPEPARKPGPYRVLIHAHLLDEAETHTVSVEIGSGTKVDLPSLSASRTVRLTGLSRDKMLERIERSARDAAKALMDVADRPLAQLSKPKRRRPKESTFSENAKLPWQWTKVRVPRPKVGPAARDLYSPNDKKRKAALRKLASLARSETSPRQVLERCVLDHVDETMRLGCLEALKPLGRRPGPTRRVIIEAFRKDDSRRVRDEATEQMLFFTGPDRATAVQAWMESASLADAYGPLDELGDQPNLDLAIRRCLEIAGANERSDNKRAFGCLALLKPVPHTRRRAILWRFLKEENPDSPYYLKGAGESEGRIGTPWGRAVKAVLEHATEWDPELESILWRRYQRTLSYSSVSTLCSWAEPSSPLADRLLEVLQTAGHRFVLNGLERISKDDAKIRGQVRAKLEEMLALGAYPKSINERDIQNTLKSFERLEVKDR